MINEELYLWRDSQDIHSYHVGIENSHKGYWIIATIGINDMSILFPCTDILGITNNPVSVTMYGKINNP